MKVALASDAGAALRLRALPEWDIAPLAADYPEETGETFYENARARRGSLAPSVEHEFRCSVKTQVLGWTLWTDGPGYVRRVSPGRCDRTSGNVERLLRELDGVSDDERAPLRVGARAPLRIRSWRRRDARGPDRRKRAAPKGSATTRVHSGGHDRTVAELGDAWAETATARGRATLRQRLGGFGGRCRFSPCSSFPRTRRPTRSGAAPSSPTSRAGSSASWRR